MSYFLDDKEFDFKRVTTQDALKVQGAMIKLANKNASNDLIDNANNTISTIAFKYLRVKNGDEWVENVDLKAFDLLFDNEFASIEIVAKFQERLQGFLNRLPSFAG